MKKIIVLVTCFASLAGAVMAQQKPKSLPVAKNALEDTIQYSLGVYMMQQFFAKTGFTVTNPALFTKAINDVLEKKKLMVDPATTQDRLLAYQHEFQLAKGARYEEILMKKAKAEGNFKVTAGNVYYQTVKMGTGVRPVPLDTIIVNVIITLPDGTEVENTNKSKQSYMALMKDMVPGLQDVLVLMPEGSIFRAIIPAAKAFGAAGTSTIPPNSAVVYDVALVQVKKAK